VFTGTGSPGDTVFVTVNGSPVTGSAVVQPDGTFSLTTSCSVPNGASLVAHSGSPSGPASSTLLAVAPLPSPVPTVTSAAVPVAGGATFITTTNAPPGAVVEVVDSSLGGEVLGSQTAPSSGALAVALNAPVPANQTLELVADGQVYATLGSGNAGSPPVVVNGTVLTSGSVVQAQGSPGAVMQVIGPQGQVFGSAVVNAQGAASIPVSGASAGQALSLAQNGVAVKLNQPALSLGSNHGFLSSNVFNPLKGTPLSIGYKATCNGHVTIKVFDAMGELVRFCDDLEVSNGQLYASSWDGRNQNGETVSSGVYIVSIYGSCARILKKVIVLK
jgi:hypothetical protein